MKKVFKIIGIVVIVIVALVIAYQVYIVISDKVNDYNVKKEQEKLQEERINAKTLMEYVKTHDYKYIQCDDENNCNTYNMAFTTKDFKCDALDNIKVLDNNYLITKDNEIYDISFNELYSNNQNCKKKETNIDIKDIKKTIRGYSIISKDNKLYDLDLNEYDYSTTIELKIFDNDDNMIIFDTQPLNDYGGPTGQTNTVIALVLKSDNNIYKQYYKETYNYNTLKNEMESTAKFSKEEVYKSLAEYGNIKYISLDNYKTNDSLDYKLEENTIKTIISDKGYYYLDEVKTDECIKYKDIECKLELKESEIYKRFSKDIKFIGQQYTILSDNSVIETQYLTYPLDKDLKN